MRTKAPAFMDMVALMKNGPDREFGSETGLARVYAPDHICLELVFTDPRSVARACLQSHKAYFAFDPAETVADLFRRAVVVRDENLAEHVEIRVDGEIVDVERKVARATIGGRITKKNASQHTVTVEAPHGSCRFRFPHFDAGNLGAARR